MFELQGQVQICTERFESVLGKNTKLICTKPYSKGKSSVFDAIIINCESPSKPINTKLVLHDVLTRKRESKASIIRKK